MILECTNCGLELGSVFVFVDRHTRLCLICAEQRTAAISRHPAGKHLKRHPNLTKPHRKDRTS